MEAFKPAYLIALIMSITVPVDAPSAMESPAGSTRVTGRVLQAKLDRLYFDVGVEQYIRSGCPFRLLCREDTLLTGTIAVSLPGLSVSQQVPELAGLTLDTTCRAEIIPAFPDTLSPVRIGTDLSAGSPLLSTVIPSGSLSPDSTGGRVRLVPYERRTALLYDYRLGQIDGYLSLRSEHRNRRGHRVLTVAPPVAAALSADPASERDDADLLATSLYYRYDDTSPYSLVPADSLRPMQWWCSADDGRRRAFRYDPYAGARLFRSLQHRPSSLRLHVEDRNLARLGQYFAELLARDECRVEYIDDATAADLRIWWAPLNANDCAATLRQLVQRLSADTVTGRRLNEPLALAARLLDDAAREADRERAARLARQAEQTMVEEAGVFPLFQPFLMLTLRDDIAGEPLSSDGKLSLERLVRLRMPTTETPQ